MEEPDGFADFVQARSVDLLRSAWLLTGDWHAAHDLVQTALEKSWLRWSHLDRPEAYVRRVMTTTYLSWRRRRWVAETPTAVLPEGTDEDTTGQPVDLHVALIAALRELTPKQRAVIVLRYFDDLSEADTARAIGCSVGTVKAHASRGLQSLRETPRLADTWEG